MAKYQNTDVLIRAQFNRIFACLSGEITRLPDENSSEYSSALQSLLIMMNGSLQAIDEQIERCKRLERDAQFFLDLKVTYIVHLREIAQRLKSIQTRIEAELNRE
ncbi:MAG: hypothetical protein WC477_07550 [Patescibacteria group bacterium]